MDEITKTQITNIVLELMTTKPYNNFPFLFDIIKYGKLYPSLDLAEISRLARQNQELQLATNDCQNYCEILTQKINEIGLKTKFLHLKDNTGEHVSLIIIWDQESYLLDLTFGLYTPLLLDSECKIGNSLYSYNQNQFSFSLDLDGSGANLFRKSFDIIGFTKQKEPYFYTSKNFPNTRFIGSFWHFQNGRQTAEISLTLKNDKSIKLTLKDGLNEFKDSIENINFDNREFGEYIDNIWQKLSYYGVDLKESFLQDLKYIQQNAEAIKRLKL